MNGPLTTTANELTLTREGRGYAIFQVHRGEMPTSVRLEGYTRRLLAEEALDRAGFRKTSLAGHWIRKRIVQGSA